MHSAGLVSGLVATAIVALVGIAYIWVVSRLLSRSTARPAQPAKALTPERRAA